MEVSHCVCVRGGKCPAEVHVLPGSEEEGVEVA